MTPLLFEQRYGAEWDELQQLLDAASGRVRSAYDQDAAARLAHLYRRCCEHLALARARAYPLQISARLDDLTHRAHQLIYRRVEWGGSALRDLMLRGLPRRVRALAPQVWLALLAFGAPLLLMGALTWRDPTLILSLMEPEAVEDLGHMYSDAAHSLGRARSAGGDWAMFGFYILNNIGIAFQCFAGGMLIGVGSLFFLIYNGAFIGAVAGYLTQQGHGQNFYGFVATHSAFELTAIVLSGAAGLKLGQALVAPGRLLRVQALRAAAEQTVVIIYGCIVLLLVAAAVEAFWSSSVWVSRPVKYGVASLCWLIVLGYLLFQGSGRREGGR